MRVQILSVVALVGFAVPALSAEGIADEAKAIEKIELLGGQIVRSDTLPNRPVVGVSFTTSNRFNDKYVHLLKSFGQLTSLDLLAASITSFGLKEIAELRSLTSLDLCGPEITDAALNELRGLENLTELTLCGTSVTVAGQDALRKSLPKLKIIDEAVAYKRVIQLGGRIDRFGQDGSIYGIGFDATGRSEPSTWFGFFKIRSNNVPASKLVDSNLRELRSLRGVKSLTTLGFTDCPLLTDEGIKGLAQFSNLELLHLDGCAQVTSEALRAFKDHPTLTNLHFYNSKQLTDDGLRDIALLKPLKHLCLNGCTEITNVGIQEIRELRELTFLDLTQTQISGEGIKALHPLQKLETLQLQNCYHITDADMNELEALTRLQGLRLTGTKITDVGMSSFKSMTALTFLDIHASKITDVGLKELQELPNLRTLHIQACERITDAGLMSLQEIKSLEQLVLNGCSVTNSGCAELQKALPKLKISR